LSFEIRAVVASMLRLTRNGLPIFDFYSFSSFSKRFS